MNTEILHDVNTGERRGSGASIYQLLKLFSMPATNQATAQCIIDEMTESILRSSSGHVHRAGLLLMPILRAGMAMWPSANRLFPFSASSFAVAKKRKGTSEVSVRLSSLPSSCKDVLLLDTVVATGDTVNEVAAQLHRELHDPSITFCTCYASPEGLAAIESAGLVHASIVGVRSQSVDGSGYLIPRINGDAGEKLFGGLQQHNPASLLRATA
ncbi:uracil phosphoribosyltransferase [Bradyrhizobium sp. AZCC 1588]|uniref:uracil phosphoribosyltransferase n=1 Tax=unclassified Bradyrhizobium TaxID=2631580 RepID=UPI002FF2920E